MRNILIIGGTRFVGKKLLALLENDDVLNVFVASRRDIGVKNFLKIDRKKIEDLEKIFSNRKFDLVVDFINFSALDSEVLISALKNTGQEPHLISISTVYVYNRPQDVVEDKCYKEEDFDPHTLEPDLESTTAWDYTQGKQSMEAYLIQNYAAEKSTILRFPIILGEDDYTKRTYFFYEIIQNNKKIGLSEKSGKANYIFSDEAARAIRHFIKNGDPGVFNVALDESLDENEILALYCEFYNRDSSEFVDGSQEDVQSPFYFKNDFLTDCTKFNSKHQFGNFKKALFRELSKMKG